MQRKNLLVIVLSIAMCFFVIVMLIPCAVMSIHYVGTAISNIRNPAEREPAPEITYGEFPISVTYEIDGEIMTVNEIYVCEFSGYTGSGRRQWNGYIKSTGENGIVLLETKNEQLYYRLGVPSALMGDTEMKQEIEPVVIRKSTFWFNNSAGVVGEDDLYSEYGIRIVDWSTVEPIENSFVEN